MKRQTKDKLVTIPARLLLGIILFFFLLFVFALLAHEVAGEKEDWFDTKVFNFFRSHTSPAMISTLNQITFFGSTTFLFPVYGIIILYLFFVKRREDAIHVTLLVCITTFSIDILKAIFARKRPDLPLIRELSDYSFPSGHAVQSFVFCCVMIWLIWKTRLHKIGKIVISTVLVLTAIAIAISRIVLRFHFASDVVAGICVALAWVLLYFFVAERLKKRMIKMKK